MIKLRATAAALCMGIAVMIAIPANATLMLQLERINDSTAILSGSGQTVVSSSILELQGAASAGDAGVDIVAGDFAVGSAGLSFGFILFGAPHLRVGFSSTFNVEDMPTGHTRPRQTLDHMG